MYTSTTHKTLVNENKDTNQPTLEHIALFNALSNGFAALIAAILTLFITRLEADYPIITRNSSVIYAVVIGIGYFTSTYLVYKIMKQKQKL